MVVGAENEFSQPVMKAILANADVPNDQHSLILSRHRLVDGKNQADLLIVTAKTAADITDRIQLLTNSQYINQLSGQQMSIKTIPNNKDEENYQQVSLENFGFQNMILDGTKGKSPNYFYYLPKPVKSGETAKLHLKLKRSQTIQSESQPTDHSKGQDVELVVKINGVPHSINIRSLEQQKNDVFSVTVPVDSKTFNENGLMDLQFVTNGLQQSNSCLNTDENHWIYISEDSYFTFPIQDKLVKNQQTFASFPQSFTETVVVLPAAKQIKDSELLNLYRSLTVNDQLPDITLISADKVKSSQLKDHHVIFIGGPESQPLLKEVNDQLAVVYQHGIPDLADHGFLQESVQSFSWIQANPWSKEPYKLLVFDQLTDSVPMLDQALLNDLVSTDEKATIFVKTSNHQLFSNAQQIKNSVDHKHVQQEPKEKPDFSLWWVVGFIGLILFIGLVLFIIRRGNRKKEQ